MTFQDIADENGQILSNVKHTNMFRDLVYDSIDGPNRMLDMFDISGLIDAIDNTQEDEICILIGHWSINKPAYDMACDDTDTWVWDWDELEDLIGCRLYVNQYDDLCANPHGLEVY